MAKRGESLERAMEKMDDWYRILYQTSSDAIMVLDDRRFVDCNDATLRIFGVPDRETFCSLHPADVSPPFQRDGTPSLKAAADRIRTAFERGYHRFEWLHRRQTGEDFPAEVWLTRLETGNRTVLQATVRDVTERKRVEEHIQHLNRELERRVTERNKELRESEAKFRSLVEESLVGVYIIQNRRFRYCNPTMAEVFGYSRQEIVDRVTVAELIAEEDRARVVENIRRCVDGEIRSLHYGFTGVRGDGRIIEVETYGTVTEYEGHPAVIGTLLDVTEQKRARYELQLRKAYFQQLFENAPDGIVILDNCKRVMDANPAFQDLFGYRVAQLKNKMLSEPIVPREFREDAMDLSDEVLRGRNIQKEAIRQTRDGTWVDVVITAVPITLEDDQIGVYGVYHDISPRKRAERALHQEKELAETTLHAIGDGVIRVDGEGRVHYMNPVAERLTGWTAAEAVGRLAREIFRFAEENKGCGPSRDIVARCFAEGRVIEMEPDAPLQSCDGQQYVIEVSVAPIHDHDNRIFGVVLVFRDVSERRRTVQQMAYQASHDALTGLFNRYEFESCADALLERVGNGDGRHALLYIDLDQFKVVNDTCGHPAGDELLRQLGSLMQTQVRSSDVLARLGGDEFGVLLRDCRLDRARVVAENFIRVIREFRFIWEGHTFMVGASVGVVEINRRTSSVAILLSAADHACYMAKEAGRNRVRIHHPGDRELVQRQDEMSWVSRINQALEEARFRLFYQEIESLDPAATQRRRRELLVRMIDEDGRLVSPGIFIPAAERYNLMPSLDRWVIEQALAGIRSVVADGQSPIQYSINISGTSLSQEDLLDFVRSRVEHYDIDPACLCFEITETAAIASFSDAVRFIRGVRGMGGQIALDDFGSGVSSFAYLKNLHVDYLKIDGSFVSGMAQDEVSAAMVESIHRIGNIMGIRTVAEFAESEEIVERLRQIGVDFGQGFALHRPEAWEPGS